MRAVVPVVIAVGAGFLAGWVVRHPARAVPEVVVRLVRGPVRVVEVPEACADPVTSACADQERVAVAVLGLPDEVGLQPPTTETACQARVELAAAMTTARQLEELGRPLPFPPDLPDKYREPAFTEVVRRVVETCPELGLDLRRVDCSELPCMALFVRSGGQARPASCAAWREAYGDGQASSNDVLVGPEGERLGYELLGPVIPKEFLPPDPVPAQSIVWPDAMKRLMQRGQEAKDEVIGDFGARERTEDEDRADQRRYWQDQIDQGNEGAAQMLQMLEYGWAAEGAR